MNSFTWGKHFITGLSEVDQQHRHLVDIINQYGSLLVNNELIFDDIEAVYENLSSYAQRHFREEEEMMIRMRLDKRHLDVHLEAHKVFLQETVAMHAGFSPDNPNAARHLLDFLIHWLAYHILGSDQNMARQIKAIEAGVDPAEAYEIEERMRDDKTEPLLVALNGLFRQVSARNKELVRLNLSLEEKVAERTRALSEANLHLEELALTDALTGLPNRRHAMRQLEIMWQEHAGASRPLVVMMIDADHFKQVNDTYGHDVGDVVLRQLSTALHNSVRNDDLVFRLGGDEFLIICPETDQQGGIHLAEQIRTAIAKLRVPTGDSVWQGSISIGVAAANTDMQDHDALIVHADRGVFAAKRDGKNCVRSIN